MQVELRFGESFDSLVRRFKKVIQRDEILVQLCNRELLGGKPSHKKKFKRERALARFHKRERIRKSFGG